MDSFTKIPCTFISDLVTFALKVRKKMKKNSIICLMLVCYFCCYTKKHERIKSVFIVLLSMYKVTMFLFRIVIPQGIIIWKSWTRSSVGLKKILFLIFFFKKTHFSWNFCVKKKKLHAKNEKPMFWKKFLSIFNQQLTIIFSEKPDYFVYTIVNGWKLGWKYSSSQWIHF